MNKLEPGVYLFDEGGEYGTVILIEKSGNVFNVLGKNDYMGTIDKLDRSKLGQKINVTYDP